MLLFGLTAILFTRLPSGFLPTEDQGSIITAIQAPAGATRERTEEAIVQVRAFYATQPQVQNVFVVRGFSFFGQGQGNAIVFVNLKPWNERKGVDNKADAIVGRAMGAFMQIKQAMVFALNPPAIQELGTAGGFTFKLQDRGGHGHKALIAAQGQLLGLASQSPVLLGVRPEGQPESPQLRVLIDRIKARALGLSIGDVNDTLAISFGSAYANQMIRPMRKPLIVMMPKSMLRNKESVSLLEDRATGHFQPVIPETENLSSDQVRRIILCSGKIYYELLAYRRKKAITDMVIIRLEQLYPFPHEDFQQEIDRYGQAKEIIWCQEEPGNQGAWHRIQHYIIRHKRPDQKLGYALRPSSASPYVGYLALDRFRQNELIEAAFRDNL